MTERSSRRPAVTVAVVSWNTSALLEKCLQSLGEDVNAGLADVWVVDNGSSDGSSELVRDAFPWVNLIASADNLGFGAAVNAVAARTSTPWLAPANADVRLQSGTLRALIENGEHHPEAAVIAPRLILPDGSTQHSAYPFPTVPFTVAYCCGVTRVSRRLASYWCIDGGFDPARERAVPWAVGAFLLVRRSAWNEVGGFSDEQWMYAEDLDLGWRLARAGWTVRYVPSARVFHAESAATTQAFGHERHVRWHASTYAWMLRRRGLVITRLIATINVFSFLLRATVGLPGALVGIAAAERLRRDGMNAARAHMIGLRRRDVLNQIR